jgi:two-component system, sensor histidine kinase and response regulator
MSGDGRGRILVVEDVVENVRLLDAVWRPKARKSSRPTDSILAFELVESAKPDLVLFDVVMPPAGRTRSAE